MTETPTGELAPAYKYDATNVLKGAEMLGRHLGMFKDTVNHVSEDGSMTPAPTLTAEIAKAISKDLDDEY